jgi:hypothetical protein
MFNKKKTRSKKITKIVKLNLHIKQAKEMLQSLIT